MTAVRSRLVPGLLFVVLVGLLATSAWLRQDRRESLDNGALAVAKQEATNFFSLDHRHAEDDVDRVLSLATDPFKSQYAAKRDEVVAGVTSKKLVVTATLPEDGTAVEYFTETKAQVLVSVDATTRQEKGEETQRHRTRIKLEKIDGRWLVSGIETVG